MTIVPPLELCGYFRFEDGKVVAIKEIPEELKEKFEAFSKAYEEARKKTIISEV